MKILVQNDIILNIAQICCAEIIEPINELELDNHWEVRIWFQGAESSFFFNEEIEARSFFEKILRLMESGE